MDAKTISEVMSHPSRRRTAEQRKGAPKSQDRCPCGKMTLRRAIAHSHVAINVESLFAWTNKVLGHAADSYTCKMYVECKGD